MRIWQACANCIGSLHQRLSVDDTAADPNRRHSDVFGGSLPPQTILDKETHVDSKETQVKGENTLETASATEDHVDEKATIETPDGEEPTEYENKHLRHVSDKFPMAIFLVAFVELCERFTYYGISGLFQNYIQRPLDGSQGRGALGMGHQGATGLTTFFQFWCYVTPILGAIIADQYLGRYLTIVMFCIVYIIGLLILFLTSLPVALRNGAGLGGFITAIIVIGLGTGGIKSNVAPLIADQYKRRRMAVHTQPKTGERVILDPNLTIQRIYLLFYFCINIGCLALLPTPYMERLVGFWSAYLLGFLMFLCGLTVLIFGKKLYVVTPPQGSVITDAFKAMWIMVRNRHSDAPKPSFTGKRAGNPKLPWDDKFIDELKRALIACRVFCFYPIYWVCYGQFSGNFISQGTYLTCH